MYSQTIASGLARGVAGIADAGINLEVAAEVWLGIASVETVG
jgi:hypothetical protein